MSLNVEEANAFVACSHYSLDDLRQAWRYWKAEGDVDGFESYIRRRIDGSANARIRQSLSADPLRRAAA